MINNQKLLSRLKQPPLDTCRVRETRARDVLFAMLNKTLFWAGVRQALRVKQKGTERRLKLHKRDFPKSEGAVRNCTYLWGRTCRDTICLQKEFYMEDNEEVEILEMFVADLCWQELHQYLGLGPKGSDAWEACADRGLLYCSCVWMNGLWLLYSVWQKEKHAAANWKCFMQTFQGQCYFLGWSN